MRQFPKNLLITIALIVLLVVSASVSADADEILYKTCFPQKSPAVKEAEECKDEDCGLAVNAEEEVAPRIEKAQTYKFLGATDHGIIWGANTYRVLGEERVRFLLYVVTPAVTKVTYQDKGYALIPERVIRTAFFSSFGEYRGSSVSVSYKVEKKVERQEEADAEKGVLEMVDLHCSAKKLKIYDNHTLYYRTINDPSNEGSCVELLWEKPKTPLRWQPVSSLMMDILTRYYCKNTH